MAATQLYGAKKLVAIPRVESRAPNKNTIEWEIPGKAKVVFMLVERIGYTVIAEVKSELFTASSWDVVELMGKLSDFLEKYGYCINPNSVEYGEKVGDPEYFKRLGLEGTTNLYQCTLLSEPTVWKGVFDSEMRELLEAPNEDVEQIIDLLMTDRVNPEGFVANVEILLGKNDSDSIRSASRSVLSPPKTPPWDEIPFWSAFSRPLGIPLWFLAAYPDVWVWWDKQQEKYGVGTEEGITIWKNVFGTEIEENTIGKIRPSSLRNSVQYYKSETGQKLETAISDHDQRL